MKKFRPFFDNLFRNLPLVFGVCILLMDFVAVLAPVLAHLGMDNSARGIYFIYQFLCHQRPWRSLHLFDYQMAWCTRDTSTYLALGLAAFFVIKWKLRNIKWYIPILAILPFAVDGTLQLVAEIRGVLNNEIVFFYASTNLTRMLTGSIFGAGTGLWIFSLLDEAIHAEFNLNVKNKMKCSGKKHLIAFLLILLICFISYLGFIQVWRLTSSKYLPYGLLDYKRYFPGYNYEETGRCGHGI